MNEKRILRIAAGGLAVVAILLVVKLRSLESRLAPAASPEKGTASSSIPPESPGVRHWTDKEVQEERTNKSLDEVNSILERSKIVMKFKQFDGLLSHAEAQVDPRAWDSMTLDMKRMVGMALYRKAGNSPVYILDGYSGKQLARQGPRGLDIE